MVVGPCDQKWQIKEMFKAAASHIGSNISDVVGEETGIIAANPVRRPRDVTFCKDQTLHAIEFESMRGFKHL